MNTMNVLKPTNKALSVLLALAFCVPSAGAVAAAHVVSYPLPSCYRVSDQLELEVDAVAVPVISNGAIYDYAGFSMGAPVTVTIRAKEPVSTCSISPLAFGIEPRIEGSTVTFTLDRPRYLIVKIDELRELAIAADAPETEVPPAGGPGVHNIIEAPYNADPTGKTLSTDALQRAIDAVNKAGSGVVYIPDGVFTCGNIVLKSNVDIYLTGGAVIRGSGHPKDYERHYRKDSLRMNGTWFIHTEPGAENIRLFGRGTIDGNGSYMRNTHRFLNNLLVPLQCSNFMVDGLTFRDSGLWGVIPTRSKDVKILNTKHYNENDLDHENDAMAINECQNVLVRNVIAIAEDDTFSTKTWETSTDIAENWPGQPESLADVLFEDCVAWSRCATFKVGFGNFQGQRNITFRNSYSYRSMRAIAVNHRWGSPAVTNVVFENIEVEGFWARSDNVERWLDITAGEGPVDNVELRNINVRHAGRDGSRIAGSRRASVNGVKFENVRVNGLPGTSLEAANVTETNRFVRDVSFNPSKEDGEAEGGVED
jgi:hypothetical protein